MKRVEMAEAMRLVIRDYCNKAGITQAWLARRVNIHEKKLSAFMSGARTERVKLFDLLKILHHFRVTLAEFERDVLAKHQQFRAFMGDV